MTGKERIKTNTKSLKIYRFQVTVFVDQKNNVKGVGKDSPCRKAENTWEGDKKNVKSSKEANLNMIIGFEANVFVDVLIATKWILKAEMLTDASTKKQH